MKLALVALAVLMFIPAARADTVSTFTATNIIVPGNDGNETINVTFQWDDTTNSLVPGTMDMNATGPGGTGFVFVFGDGNAFDWGNSQEDSVQILQFNVRSSVLPQLPSAGSYLPELFDMDGPEDGVLGFYEGGNGSQMGVSGTFIVTVAETPEPSTWAMLLVGIALAGLLRLRASRLVPMARFEI